MMSETTRSQIGGGCDSNAPAAKDSYDHTILYYLPLTDAGWSNNTPQFGPLFSETNTWAWITGSTYHCNAFDYTGILPLYIRGCEYFRANVYVACYTHTVPPNYIGYDCGNNNFTGYHVAARSYHTGGVNVCFADGSVHFIQNTIALSAWQALGTRAGGEELDQTQF